VLGSDPHEGSSVRFAFDDTLLSSHVYRKNQFSLELSHLDGTELTSHLDYTQDASTLWYTAEEDFKAETRMPRRTQSIGALNDRIYDATELPEGDTGGVLPESYAEHRAVEIPTVSSPGFDDAWAERQYLVILGSSCGSQVQ
jgi:hypothetical protein